MQKNKVAVRATSLPAEKFHVRMLAALLAVGTVAALFTLHAQAQTSAPVASPPEAVQAAPAATPGPSLSAPATARKYAVQDVERAFTFIDSDRDGKLSRSEAAGFKNVAKYFDEADIDKDGFLSKAEFDSAVNGRKPQ